MLSGDLEKEGVISGLKMVFDSFADDWRAMQDRKKQKQLEKESLYKYVIVAPLMVSPCSSEKTRRVSVKSVLT